MEIQRITYTAVILFALISSFLFESTDAKRSLMDQLRQQNRRLKRRLKQASWRTDFETYFRQTIATVTEAVTADVTTEADLMRSAIVLHIATSTLLSLTGRHILEVIELLNALVFTAWNIALLLKSDRATEFMAKFFILRSKIDICEVPALSLILSSFSHIQYGHFAANMAALASFGPAALHKLGSVGLAHLYTAGALASAVNQCLWPVYAPQLGLFSEPDTSSVGASGAICAIIIFTCCAFKNAIQTVATPDWLRAFVKSPYVQVPLGVLGLLWMGGDFWSMISASAVDMDKEADGGTDSDGGDVDAEGNDKQRICYTGHCGGFALGLVFFVVYTVCNVGLGAVWLHIVRSLQRKTRSARRALYRFRSMLFRRRRR